MKTAKFGVVVRSAVARNALAMNLSRGNVVSPAQYQKFVKISKELFPRDSSRQASFVDELKDAMKKSGEGEVEATIAYYRRQREKELNKRKSTTQRVTGLLNEGKAMSREIAEMCTKALAIVAKLKSTRPKGLAPWDSTIDSLLADLSKNSSKLMALINTVKIPALNARRAVIDKDALASYQRTIDSCVVIIQKILNAARKFGDLDGITGMLHELGVDVDDLEACAVDIEDTASSLESYITSLSMSSKELKKLAHEIGREEFWD